MGNSIFSTYNTAENRVTSTILAVLERLNTLTVTQLLQILMEDSTIELIQYENQVKSSDSIPDGRIRGLVDYIIETKIVPNSIKKKQILHHCNYLKYDFSKLLVLTPDLEFPKELKEIIEVKKTLGEKIIWTNFDKIIEGIDTVIEEQVLLLDREKFLLLELKEFIIQERLIAEDYSNRVLVVPAGYAWKLYQDSSVYVCQANRTFKKSSYQGFYADGEIKEYFPKILGYVDSLNIYSDNLDEINVETENGTERRIVIEKLKEIKSSISEEVWNKNHKYIILTDMDDKRTFVNDNPIKNDKTSYSNKRTAFVQNQTYLDLDNLKGKKYTSEL